MFSKYFLFIAFLVTPLSAMFCDQHLLYFFVVYPFTALITRKWAYFKAVFLLIIPPVLFFVWAFFISRQSSYLQSLRWIISLTSGIYFAFELSASGISSVLRSFKLSFSDKLADVIDMGGQVIANVKPLWSHYAAVPLAERAVLTVEHSLADISIKNRNDNKAVSNASVVLAFFSWLVALVTISGVQVL